MGEAAFAETAAAMAAGLGPPGAPLRTLALILAGRPDAALPAPAAAGAIANGHPAPGTRPAAGHPAHAAPADEPRSGGSGGALSLFGLGKPRAGSAGGGDAAGSDRAGQGLHAPPGAPEAPDAGAVLDGWRANLAILAANRSPGDEGVLARLGDALWHERGMVRPGLSACPGRAAFSGARAGRCWATRRRRPPGDPATRCSPACLQLLGPALPLWQQGTRPLPALCLG